MCRVLRALLWSLALSASTSVALSQINTADLHGVITDPANAGVGDATVRVENRETGLARETKTRENGDYLFLALPPGHYKVSVDAAGFRPAVVEDVVLTIGQQAQLSFKLEISTVVEALVISADAAVVETTRTSVATTVDQRTIENLATNGRSYINLTLLDSATTRDNQPVLGPAPTSGLNIGGQRASGIGCTLCHDCKPGGSGCDFWKHARRSNGLRADSQSSAGLVLRTQHRGWELQNYGRNLFLFCST
ncbi:MAG: carboxypeptidase regulatory-like domain-containing protein [Acidobacteria bacterium]|nr:carboxypeptidase regulatory-like domain-containing protein [Acidobacteriota bacterium]